MFPTRPRHQKPAPWWREAVCIAAPPRGSAAAPQPVDADSNAFRGINNRNNNLWVYTARLYCQGNVTPQKFSEADQYVHHRRLTQPPARFDVANNILWYRSSSAPNGNKWGADFTLHSTYVDTVAGADPWKCPGNKFNYRSVFNGECSPDGTRWTDQYT